MKPNKLNVLVLDIETAPIIAYVWDLWPEMIPINQIHTDRYIMSWAAKWIDEPRNKMMYADKRHKKPGDDKAILIKLRNLLDKADIVVTHNGIKFDSRRIVARLEYHGIKPPKPFKHIDTMSAGKSVADYTSNKLEYLSALDDPTDSKYSHPNFPGFSLHRACLNGNMKAWAEMKKYNEHDVVVTERRYKKLRPYIAHLIPKVYPLTKTSKHCGTCGFFGKMCEGRPHHATTNLYRQNRCPKCGSWQKGERIKT